MNFDLDSPVARFRRHCSPGAGFAQIPKRSVNILSERLKSRLVKDRPMTTITLRIPVDVVESLKAIAPQRGFSGYQTLLKLYLSEG